jgi:hypothetical protein
VLVGVHGDGRHAFVHALRPERVPIGDVSPATLVEALRTAVRRTRVSQGAGRKAS